MKYNMSNFSLQEYLEKTEKEFNKKFIKGFNIRAFNGNNESYLLGKASDAQQFLRSAIETAVEEAVKSTFNCEAKTNKLL